MAALDLDLLAQVLLAGFGIVLTILSIRTLLRYREARFMAVTSAFALFAVEGLLLSYDQLTPGDVLVPLGGIVLINLAQLVLFYLAIVRRR